MQYIGEAALRRNTQGACVTARRRFGQVALAILPLLASCGNDDNNTANDDAGKPPVQQPVSAPGQYSGYSSEIYDGFLKTSRHVEVPDGTKLAIDIYRPANKVNGELVATDDQLPVVLSNTRYNRCPPQNIIDHEKFVKHGYVVAILDARGTGASYGNRYGPFSVQENEDARDVIEWLAAQTWSDGKIAMWGSSYMGQSQYGIPSTQPEHLVSMAPIIGGIDWYTFIYPNGVFNSGFLDSWDKGARNLDLNPSPCPIPGDTGKPEEVHADNLWPADIFITDMARDSYNSELDIMPNIDRSAISRSEAIKSSGVRQYHIGAWFDGFSAEQLAAYKLYGEKVIIAPWAHADYYDPNVGLGFIQNELLRWYDYSLKGIENGLREQAPVTYATIDTQKPGIQWNYSNEWPLPSQQLTNFYFSGKNAEPVVASVNDGGLSTQKPAVSDSSDPYLVNYDVSVFDGKYARIHRGQFADMTANPDQLSLTYTSTRLEADMEMTGHPVAHLWVTSDKPDGYFMVYLEEVNADGVSNYVSDGVIRGTHRKVDDTVQPFKDMGIPYHPSNSADLQPLPQTGTPVELAIDMFPMSYVFHKGSRIRVTVSGSNNKAFTLPDSLNYDTPPTINIFRDKDHASYISLPIIPAAN